MYVQIQDAIDNARRRVEGPVDFAPIIDTAASILAKDRPLSESLGFVYGAVTLGKRRKGPPLLRPCELAFINPLTLSASDSTPEQHKQRAVCSRTDTVNRDAGQRRF